MTSIINTLLRVTVQLVILSMQLLAAVLTMVVNLVTILVNTMTAKRNPPPRRGRPSHHDRSRKWKGK